MLSTSQQSEFIETLNYNSQLEVVNNDILKDQEAVSTQDQQNASNVGFFLYPGTGVDTNQILMNPDSQISTIPFTDTSCNQHSQVFMSSHQQISTIPFNDSSNNQQPQVLMSSHQHISTITFTEASNHQQLQGVLADGVQPILSQLPIPVGQQKSSMMFIPISEPTITSLLNPQLSDPQPLKQILSKPANSKSAGAQQSAAMQKFKFILPKPSAELSSNEENNQIVDIQASKRNQNDCFKFNVNLFPYEESATQLPAQVENYFQPIKTIFSVPRHFSSSPISFENPPTQTMTTPLLPNENLNPQQPDQTYSTNKSKVSALLKQENTGLKSKEHKKKSPISLSPKILNSKVKERLLKFGGGSQQHLDAANSSSIAQSDNKSSIARKVNKSNKPKSSQDCDLGNSSFDHHASKNHSTSQPTLKRTENSKQLPSEPLTSQLLSPDIKPLISDIEIIDNIKCEDYQTNRQEEPFSNNVLENFNSQDRESIFTDDAALGKVNFENPMTDCSQSSQYDKPYPPEYIDQESSPLIPSHRDLSYPRNWCSDAPSTSSEQGTHYKWKSQEAKLYGRNSFRYGSQRGKKYNLRPQHSSLPDESTFSGRYRSRSYSDDHPNKSEWIPCPQCNKKFISDFNLYTHVQYFCKPKSRKTK